MRRKILLFSLSLFFLLEASATIRPIEQLRSIAVAQLSADSRAKGLRRQGKGELKVFLQTPALTVMGYDKGGFVVLTNDDMAKPVLGVSTTPYAKGQNPAFDWYLRAAGSAVSVSLQSRIPVAQSIVPSGDFPKKVEPLLKTTWDQTSPYNDKLKKDVYGHSYLTGCVATAMAQIMRYHRYPSRGTGSHSYSSNGETLKADFSSVDYQWDKMRESYSLGAYSEEEGQAVAELMRQLGVAVEMIYEPNLSSSYTSKAEYALVNYFNYNANLNRYTRNFYSEEEWMNLIYTELAAGRPIYYSGADSNWNNGHAFVIDGYREDGLVDVNWGWSGSQNGYFDIGVLTPGRSSDFSYYQDMIVGIQPETFGTWKSHVMLYYDSELAIEKFSKRSIDVAAFKVWNVTSYTVKGILSLAIEGNGQTRDLVTKELEEEESYWKEYQLGMVSLPKDLPDGDYTVFLRFKDGRDADWQIVRAVYGKKNSAKIHVENGKFTVTDNPVNYDWVTDGIEKHALDQSDLPTIVYDLQGREVSQFAKGEFSLDKLPRRGVFIVKTGSKTQKIIR